MDTSGRLVVLISPGHSRYKTIEIDSNLLKTFDENPKDLFCTSIYQLTQLHT